ncbi:hypothetical protein CDIK_4102 [Cucumispora dikerogammari]|nr:hypothetical protein CDIK_4102 [Cucumispora dikerogammari]
MVDRLSKLKKFVGVNDKELAKSMLIVEEIIHIGALEETMKTIAPVNTALQGSLTLYEVRCLFDALISKFTTLNYARPRFAYRRIEDDSTDIKMASFSSIRQNTNNKKIK